MRKLSLVLALLLAQATWAQNATVNLKGFVVDERTNQIIPKEYDVTITSKNTGKKYLVKVNSKAGDFLQPVASGDTYYITFQSYFIYKKTDTIDIPSTNKYREEKHNYKVRSIVAAEQLANICAFEPGQSEISAANMPQMNELLDLIKQNRELQVQITLNAEQAPPPPVEIKKPTKASKKPAKGKKGADAATTPEPTTPAASTEAVNPALTDTRIEVLKKFFSSAKNSEIRVRIEKGSDLVASPGQKNLTAKVGDVKSILDD